MAKFTLVIRQFKDSSNFSIKKSSACRLFILSTSEVSRNPTLLNYLPIDFSVSSGIPVHNIILNRVTSMSAFLRSIWYDSLHSNLKRANLNIRK
jgi:hypothetical protein